VRISVRHATGVQDVVADRTRLRQILLNLLSNAVKYTVESDEVRVASTVDDAGQVHVSVSDHGPGLSTDQQAQLFQPFNRLGQEHGGVPGTGIGLVISRQLAQLMGGDISVSSSVGSGSVFVLRLVGADAATAPLLHAVPGGSSASAVKTVQGARPGHVIYIEDNLVNIEIMRDILGFRPSLTLHTERLAAAGLAAVRLRRPDLVLLDLRLPDLPGLEVLRQLKSDAGTARIPVVIVSASALEDDINATLTCGAADYVAKPLDVGAVLSVVDRLLATGSRHVPEPGARP
jgi:CheY-like chemotaxis protein/anti-sigma regulatory factor (Ser/Thr protein kinase)